MPTYEYVCTDCGHDLEVVQSFSDAALTECPQCSGKLRKRYSPVGVVFKGSGFYKTDSRQKLRKGSDEPSKPAAAVSGGRRSLPVARRRATLGASKGTDGAAKRSGQSDSGGASQKPDTSARSVGLRHRVRAGQGLGQAELLGRLTGRRPGLTPPRRHPGPPRRVGHGLAPAESPRQPDLPQTKVRPAQLSPRAPSTVAIRCSP